MIASEIFTEQEADSLILAFAGERGGKGITEEEGQLLIDWASRARLDVMLLGLVLRGCLGIDIQEGEIVFTSKGEILPTGPA